LPIYLFPRLYLIFKRSAVAQYAYITVFQEIVWRGFAFLLLEKIIGDRKQVVILYSAILFALMHIYFRSVLLVFGTWLLGMEWGKHYWKFRSIAGPVVAHYLFGVLLILLNYWSLD
jgi:membrane protease YdiL (CAAX protease family)